MLSAGDFRNGVTFELDGEVMQVVEFQHVKPGKGAAFVRTKMKNVITGAVTERTPCSPKDSQEYSPIPQFKSIISSVLSLLYGPTLTSTRDYWKNHSFD